MKSPFSQLILALLLAPLLALLAYAEPSSVVEQYMYQQVEEMFGKMFAKEGRKYRPISALLDENSVRDNALRQVYKKGIIDLGKAPKWTGGKSPYLVSVIYPDKELESLLAIRGVQRPNRDYHGLALWKIKDGAPKLIQVDWHDFHALNYELELNDDLHFDVAKGLQDTKGSSSAVPTTRFGRTPSLAAARTA